ncbi:HalOD1 output domain-containing protein [Halosolutus halophilus]|uniref:HalOD1 output domain-containing protein n=1 Tax=Halosolutus halophilus TaxID=1552990 RepID=UPI0022350E72|nr:HalOD1 output domain-containing protein [Halosolutus halophilus]
MGNLTRRTETHPAIEIIDKISEIEGQDPSELPPLYNTVDPDSLERLAESTKIQFEYMGHNITVENGTISIDE